MTTLYVARHGETTWNLEKRFQGLRFGGELTARGRAQADAVAALVATLGCKRLLASPLRRALETAETIAARAGLVVETRDALGEIDFGDASGLTQEEARARWPEALAARERDKWSNGWPGGESYADLFARVEGWLAQESFGEGPVLIVAHQTINRVIAATLAAVPFAVILDSEQPGDVLLRVHEVALTHAHAGAFPARWADGPHRRGCSWVMD